MSSYFIDDGFNREQDVKSFIAKYSDYNTSELSDIIKKYISYDPAAVSAALHLSVDKGSLSYDLKELLWKQIMANYTALNRSVKNYGWQRNNAFIEFFKNISDDEIYDLIDNPGGISTDAFHAILASAKDRELISDEEFEENFEFAQADESFKVERRTGAFEKLSEAGDYDDLIMSEGDLAAEQSGTADMPELNLNEKSGKRSWGPVRSGFYLIASGLLIIGINFLRPHISFFHRHYHIVEIIFASFFILLGIIFIGYGFYHSGKDTFMEKRTRN